MVIFLPCTLAEIGPVCAWLPLWRSGELRPATGTASPSCTLRFGRLRSTPSKCPQVHPRTPWVSRHQGVTAVESQAIKTLAKHKDNPYLAPYLAHPQMLHGHPSTARQHAPGAKFLEHTPYTDCPCPAALREATSVTLCHPPGDRITSTIPKMHPKMHPPPTLCGHASTAR